MLLDKLLEDNMVDLLCHITPSGKLSVGGLKHGFIKHNPSSLDSDLIDLEEALMSQGWGMRLVMSYRYPIEFAWYEIFQLLNPGNYQPITAIVSQGKSYV